MKKTLINGVIVLVFVLLAPQVINAQGTITYLSNLGQTSAGSNAVGSDSWLAVGFETGNNTSGYTLNSIQLAMTDASGNPSGFTIMIYSAISNGQFSPGSSLGTLNGSLNPVTGGIFTYTPDSNFTLSRSAAYFIVLTAGTTVANGAYDWSCARTYSYNPSGGWVAPLGITAVDNYQSSDGSHWNFIGGPCQFAINATAVPEPSTSFLLLLGSGVFMYARRAFRR